MSRFIMFRTDCRVVGQFGIDHAGFDGGKTKFALPSDGQTSTREIF